MFYILKKLLKFYTEFCLKMDFCMSYLL